MAPRPGTRSPKLWRLIGARVRAAREAAGYGPGDFALRVGVSRQMLDLIERGRRGARVETLYRIARTAGAELMSLLPPVDDL